MQQCLKMLPELLLSGSLLPHCTDPQRFRQAAFAVQVAEATARFLGQSGPAAATAPAATAPAAEKPAAAGTAAAAAAEGGEGHPCTNEVVSNAIPSCMAMCSAALQLGFKLNHQLECGHCTAPTPELGKTLHLLLHAVGSLLATGGKLQVVNRDLDLLTCSLATGVDLLHAWHVAAAVDAKLACMQQQQQQQQIHHQQQQQQAGEVVGSRSACSQGAAAAPAALHVVGCHLLLMSSQVEPPAAAAAAAAAPGTLQHAGAVQLPGWLAGAQAQRFALQPHLLHFAGGQQQHQQAAEEAQQQQQQQQQQEQKEVQDLHTFRLVDFVLGELAVSVADGCSSSSSSSAAAGRLQLIQNLQQALDCVSSLKTWYEQQQQQDASPASCKQQQLQRQQGKGDHQQQLQQQQQQQGVGSTPCKSLVTLQQSLQQAGQALCAAARCSSCCCNPGCTNLTTVSECFALVRGRGCVCSGCLAEEVDSSGTAGASLPAAAR
jgi:hypothetical protein